MKNIVFLLIVFFQSQSGFAQIQIHTVQISSGGMVGSRNVYSFQFASGQMQNTIDTIPSFGISSFLQQEIPFDGYHIQYSQVDPADQFNRASSSTYLDIRFNPNSQTMISVDEEENTTSYYNYPNFNYTDETGSYIKAKNIPYSISLNKDTIRVSLNAAQMKNIQLDEKQYKRHVYSRDYSGTDQYIMKIPDGANFTITIIGAAPLLVDNRGSENTAKPIVNLASKVILVQTFMKPYLALAAFDLLGRKHDLEFLNTDGASSSYSLRSLRPGIYFVNDGTRTFKFLIP
ncbi:MAG: hypothetical protein Q8916_07905 [Bacteroidota bacterium]|nr:hypothetical protein [Bacteroidota bacterium]MDP4230310.1 hypothetical protein [Bacteroidota bacterium]